MEPIAQFYSQHLLIIFYLLACNLLAFFLYFIDKVKARHNSWRIRERTLLLFALSGGSIGAILAMKLFRHKTKKNSFLLWFFLIVAIQVTILVYLPTAVDYLQNLDISF
jgi:uncharacterized membrane protein YsdA (DUF1294 family)